MNTIIILAFVVLIAIVGTVYLKIDERRTAKKE
jgi:hypothetical protein